MKTLFCLALFSVAGNATLLFVDSDAANTTNSSSQATVDLTGTLNPNPGWAAALAGSNWISYGPTGDSGDPGYFSPANGTLVTFTTQFTLSGAITGGSLFVLADDSTSVVLNTQVLIAADLTPGAVCSNVPVGCLQSTEAAFTFAQLAPYLVDGVNTLSFGVVQVGGGSFGLDFAGSVNDGSTPEPMTVALIGAGLVALATLRRRK
jgi:hypothetical protein